VRRNVRRLVLLAAALLAPVASPAADFPEGTALAPGAVLLTIGDALKAGLARNPDLLNATDAYVSAAFGERAVASGFLPQATPFYETDRDRGTGRRTESYGLNLSQQFSFGPSLQGIASVTRGPEAGTGYASDIQLSLRQSLLRGADPAVPAEPLREARRATQAQLLSYETQRRRTVLSIYQAYLQLAEQEQTLQLALERAQRSRRLTEFSQARFLAGSVSRLDVLRAEQQEAQANLAINDAANAVEDARDLLRRTAGLRKDFAFCIRPPEDLPLPEPDLDQALDGLLDRQPAAVEARAEVTDAEFGLRIARSFQLPSLDAVLGYERIGAGKSAGDALRTDSSSVHFGFSTQYGLNAAAASAQARIAAVALEEKKRNFALLAEDLERAVRQAYRRLDVLERNHEIAQENARVAELQARVAQLRYEKGLSDNFNVVDAESLLNSARLFELDSRFQTLLSRLECLSASGYLEPSHFLVVP
jgi:outer membrane protein